MDHAHDDHDSLFRQEALEHHLQVERGEGLVHVSPPWTWSLLWTVVVGVVAALIAAILGRVEITARGRGIIRPAAGVRLLVAQVDGTVRAIGARSGDVVEPGAVLLRLEAPEVQAAALVPPVGSDEPVITQRLMNHG